MSFFNPTAIKSFILGQYFTDGVKMTLGVLLPAVIFSFLGDFRTGISISLGAFLVSISDSTGPLEHRRTGMLASCGFVFLSALVTGVLNQSPVLLAIEIPVFCFVFAMFTVYGTRAASVGAGALLGMAISMDPHKTAAAFWLYALMVLAGGIWYTMLSLSIMQIRPYRVAQQALGESVLQVAAFLRQKAAFYSSETDVETNYRKLAAVQVAVNEHQDSVREMLYKTRKRVGESISSGQLLLVIFVDMVDIFEQMMASHYDYKKLRELYGQYPVMHDFKRGIQLVAEELSRLGYALINNEKPRHPHYPEDFLAGLREQIEALEQTGVKCLMLRKIYANLASITARVDDIYNYFYEDKLTFISQTREASLSKFIGHQSFSLKLIRDNLTLESNVFRHA